MESAAAIQKRCAASDPRRITETVELAITEAQEVGIISENVRLYKYVSAEEIGSLVHSARETGVQLEFSVDTAVVTVSIEDGVVCITCDGEGSV